MANPDIPSFKNPDPGEPKKEEEKKGGAGLLKTGASEEKKTAGAPSLFGRATSGSAPKSGFGSAPALKVRGLSGGPKSLFDRLKQFQKKDLIFIASGLGVLFLAPLAEHFMMNPTQGPTMQPGFNQQGGGSFGPEVGVHEPGAGGLSPGSLVGANSDIITPLNVRDPSALVMAPGAQAVQPAPGATQVAPPAQGSASKDSSWKDALATAAKEGASKGSEAAKPAAFKAPGQMAGALRGLSALSGGSYGGGPTFSLPAPNAGNVPNRPTGSNSLSQVQAAPGYKGVGSRGLDSGGNADALRKAGENAANLFNRAGGAAGNLEQAAREAIPTGGATNTGGGTSGGDQSKAPGGNSSKDNKALGESLAYLKAKMEMEKAVDLEWSIKKWKEFEFPKMIYEEITKSAIQNILGNGMFAPFGKMLAGGWAGLSGQASGARCTYADGTFQEYPDNGTAHFYCTQNQVFSQPLDAQSGQSAGAATQITGGSGSIPCNICSNLGGASSANSGAGGANPANPQQSAPGTGNNGGNNAQAPGSPTDPTGVNQGSDKLAAFIKSCNDHKASSGQQPVCDSGVLDKLQLDYQKLQQVPGMIDDAQKLRDIALQHMNDGAKGLEAAKQNLLKDYTDRLGASDNPVDGTALAEAQAAQKALKDPADPAADKIKQAAQTDPTVLQNPAALKPLTDALTGDPGVQSHLDKVGNQTKQALGDVDGNVKSQAQTAKGDIDQGAQALDQSAGTAKQAAQTVKGALDDAKSQVGGANVGNSQLSKDILKRTLGDMQTQAAPLTDKLKTLAGDSIATTGDGQVGGALATARDFLVSQVQVAEQKTCGPACKPDPLPPSLQGATSPSGTQPAKADQGAQPNGPDALSAVRAAATGSLQDIGGSGKTALKLPDAATYAMDRSYETQLQQKIAGGSGSGGSGSGSSAGGSSGPGAGADATSQLSTAKQSLDAADKAILSAKYGP